MMPEGTPKVFVSVVTYKEKEWHDCCFLSLRESVLPVQMVVVDNASGNGSAGYIKENYLEVHIIESDKNLGFGDANNIGMRYALDNGANYVFLLNQYAWIEQDTIKCCLNASRIWYFPANLNAETNNIKYLLHWGFDIYGGQRFLNYY